MVKTNPERGWIIIQRETSMYYHLFYTKYIFKWSNFILSNYFQIYNANLKICTSEFNKKVYNYHNYFHIYKN